ncbi:type IV toxin-antitoxin system AbiEi family antitoxin [Mycobacterium neumannii]|uniref:type IV toxin-antitoxin system AbiEi family antitoxin n=1 Tax=Mycobacterium neumannii TaxID=2048551 RepID=UPI000B944A4C|nr:type IV toxin-antitoxin system AbiEi family antitoxin [Mycobacterium neumannii]
MERAFLGNELLEGGLTRSQLRWRYRSVHPRVYVPRAALPSLQLEAHAAWLWSNRRGIVAGRAAASLHGAQWVSPGTVIELIGPRERLRSGVVVRNERIDWDEICTIGELAVTTPARTTLDLARHLNRDLAVRHLDALAAATGVKVDDVAPLVERYRGWRGMKRARIALDLMDGGAQSPKETWLRLLVLDAGYPRPRTQIRVCDGAAEAFLDMGWDEPMIALDYDGEQHQTDRPRFVHDIGRNAMVENQGWLDIHVVKEHSRGFTLHRLREAAERRGWSPLARRTPGS